jgi:hypothetical protein
VTEARLVGLPEPAQRLVSAALFAAQHLERTELAGLERTIHSATRSKRDLRASSEQSTSSEEEAHIT